MIIYVGVNAIKFFWLILFLDRIDWEFWAIWVVIVRYAK